MPTPDPARDPDALWKPGYTGGYRIPDPSSRSAGPRGGRVRAGRLAAGAAIAVVVLGAVLVASSLRGEPPPRQLQPWTTTLDTVTVGAVAASPDRVVALVDRPGVLVVFDLADGAEQWRRSAPGDSATGLDVVGADDGDEAAVVVRHVDADGSGSVLALDLATGATRWRWSLAVGERVDVVGVDLVRTSVRDTPNGPAGRARIDPLSGEEIERLDGLPDEPAPTDNVLRSFGTASGVARASREIEGGVVVVSIDPAVAATTFEFTPTVAEDDLAEG